jgi:hypothetical protein
MKMRNTKRTCKNGGCVFGKAVSGFGVCTRRVAFTDLRTLIALCAIAVSLCSSGFAKEPATGSTAETNAKAVSVAELHGVSLGKYRIRSYYPVDAQKSTVRFTLYAAVTDEHYDETQQLIDDHREKLRDQIITATRLAPLAVFQEPDLAAFRRRIIVRLRRAIPELQIDDLYVSDFDLAIKSL